MKFNINIGSKWVYSLGYCNHTGFNPLGSCEKGKELGSACIRDTYCKSQNCHLLKCVKRKPVKDGPCTKDQHQGTNQFVISNKSIYSYINYLTRMH